MRGVSGHVHNPFAGALHGVCILFTHMHTLILLALYTAISIGTPSETSGEVRGFSFIYSGNFLVEAELSEMGRLRCNIGINPMGLQWHLLPGLEYVV